MAAELKNDAKKGATAARLRSALAGLAGPRIGCCVLPIQSGCKLFREEEALIANAVESRQHEFATGRACARTALGEFGCPPLPILRGAFYEPIWPRGFGGSIAHVNTFAAAIAYRTGFAKLHGIDLLSPSDVTLLMETTWTFLTPNESATLGDADAQSIARIFSAKEAAIKIASVRRQAFTDFKEIESRITADGMLLDVAGEPSPIAATFSEIDGFLVTLAIGHDSAARDGLDRIGWGLSISN
jgi:4'-phosphopantetheinyl transferase EntD